MLVRRGYDSEVAYEAIRKTEQCSNLYCTTATTTTSSTRPASRRWCRRRPAGDEAHKTEPDKNTYLVFKHGLAGADAGYDYGTHFLFQGHEGGAGGAGYITRINLDADAAHRVTLLATTDVNGNPLATIDGSTWDPWAKRLLLTTENPSAPTYAATPDYPSRRDISAPSAAAATRDPGRLGGNIWIVEDIGGSTDAGHTARAEQLRLPYVRTGRPPTASSGAQVSRTAPITSQPGALNSPDRRPAHLRQPFTRG